MPITEHAKLGVHARPSHNSLVAVPFKKRRFLFTRPPSPPIQLPSSAPEDCDAQRKPESSGLESPLSETCSHPGQVDVVTGDMCAVTGKEVSSDSVEDPIHTDVNVSPTHDTILSLSDPGLGSHVKANSVNVTKTEQEMVLNNKILPVMGSSQLLPVMQMMLEMPQKVGSDEGKIVQSEGTMVLNSNLLSVMGNRHPLSVMGNRQSPSEMQKTLEVPQKVGDAEGKIVLNEVTLVLNKKVLPVMGSTQSAAVMQETLDVAQKVANDEGKIVQSERTLVLNNKVLPVTGSTQTPLVLQETLDVAQKVDEGKVVLCEGISSKEDNMEQKAPFGQSSDTELKVDSSYLSLSRSNWDLNTTMDTWEGSRSGFAVNHGSGTSTNGRIELDGMHLKGLEFGLEDSLYEGPSGTNVMLGNHSLQTNGHDSKLLNLSTVIAEHSNSVACLDLQLKPSFLSNACTKSANLNTLREMPYLSLSVNPTNGVSSHIPQLSISVVKSEPFGSDHRDTRKVHEMGRPNPLALKNIKSEPCEGYETSKSTVSSESFCSIIVKREPLAQTQGCYKSPEEKLIPVDLVGRGFSRQSAKMHQNAGTFHDSSPEQTCESPKCKSPEGRAFQMELAHGSSIQNTVVHQKCGEVDDKTLEDACKPLGLDERKVQSDIDGPSTHITGVSNNMDSQLKQCNDFPLDTVTHNAAEETTSKPLHIAIRPMISGGNEFNSMKKLCETENLPLLHKPLVSECKDHTMTDGMPGVAYNSSETTQIDEQLTGQNEHGKVVESNEVKVKIATSPCTHEKNCEFESKVALSQDATGVKSLHKQGGTGDEDYEDGEVRDLALLNIAVEGPPSKESDVEQVKDIETVSPVDVPAPKASLAEEKEIPIHNTSEVKDHGTVDCEIGPCYDKDVVGFSSSTLHNGDSFKGQPSKTILKLSKDNIKKHKDLEKRVKSDIGLSISKDIEAHQAYASNQQDKSEGSHSTLGKNIEAHQAYASNQQDKSEGSHPTLGKDIEAHQAYASNRQDKSEGSQSTLGEFSELWKIGSSQADGATKDFTNTGQHSRIIYLNSASNKLACEKMRSESVRSSSSKKERGSPADRSFNRDRSDSRGSRDEHCKFGVDRRQFYQAGRQVTDFVCNRDRTDERVIALSGDKNTDSGQLLEHGNRLNGIRFPRRPNDSEIANAAASDGFNYRMRKRSNDEYQNSSRMPCRGRTSGARGQGMMGCHPIRNISPGRCIGRDVPDFVLVCEENLMRNLPDDMMEPSITSHPFSQYERSEGIFVRRERGSLSPTQRRGVALHLPANCSDSSSRAQQRSPHQRAAPGRCLNGYRSPEMVRLGKMRSTHQRPCFQDDMAARRRGLPPYNGPLADDVIDMAPPSREHNFPRTSRGSNRSIRRFNLFGHREIAEEDHFGPPLPNSQIREFAEEDEYAEDRRCDRGPLLRSFRQRCAAADDNEKLRFCVDDGPGTFRLCPEDDEGFPGGDNPRDFSGRFRNRLGNTSGRFRGIVQDDDGSYRHHDAQGYGDVRMKRRRF